MTEIENDEPTQDDESASKTDMAKSVAKAIVSHSVRFAVAGALSSFVPVESRKDKVRLAIASYAISGVVSEKAKEYISDSIDEKIEFVVKVRAQLEKNKHKDDTDEDPNP